MHYPSRSLVLYFSFDLVCADMCTSQVFMLVEPMELDLLFMYPLKCLQNALKCHLLVQSPDVVCYKID